KIALFFIALFSQFVALGNDLSNQMIIVATPFVVDGLWYTFITLVLSSSKVVDRIRSKAVLIDRLSGIVLMLLALRVVVTV
ncbi:lysine transporter LysE, partial [Vibrio parahaemolyticus]|nr:lysine transporter LysE [Vibrio parahaemolyticus]